MSDERDAANDNGLQQSGVMIARFLAFVAIAVGLFQSSVSYSPVTALWVTNVDINLLLVAGLAALIGLRRVEKSVVDDE